MLELEAAQERIGAVLQPLGAEAVALSQAYERISAEKILAPIDLPVFDNSAMDGYAVRAADLAAATATHAQALRLIGQVPAGTVFGDTIKPGECVRLYTGSPLPPGADAVVMQESTRVDPAQPETVWFLSAPQPGEFVRHRGEDCGRGTVLVEAGVPLTVGRLCLLAAAGLTEIRVGRQPKVGLVATGSELQESGTVLAPGHIYECNRVGLTVLLKRSGARPCCFPLVPDTLRATRQALDQALAECEVVLTSGGVSVGELDWVKDAFEQMGGELEFWRVAIKPGRPFVFGQCRGKYLFGLPGNPVSALVTFLLLVRPALARLQGAGEVALPKYPGLLAEALTAGGSRRHFVRVVVDGAGKVRSAGTQASHILSSLAEANGLVEVPAGETLRAGSWVQVLRWD